MKIESADELRAKLEICINECDHLTNNIGPELYRKIKEAMHRFNFTECDKHTRGINQISARIYFLVMKIKEIKEILHSLGQEMPKA